MNIWIFEIGPCHPLTAQNAINLNGGTIVLNVLLDAFKSLDLLEACEALDLEA